MSKGLDINSGNFEQEVIQSERPVLVDFWAPNCGPCRAIAVHLEALAEEMAERLKVVKVNTAEAWELAAQYGVMHVPTLLVFKGGHVVETMVGTHSRQAIAAKLQPHLS